MFAILLGGCGRPIVTVGGVERRIDLSNLDLDRAAAMVAARCAGWRERGFVTAELTWMDNDASWPAPLLQDRGQAGRPKSLGVRVHGDAGEAEFVLYAGGWADVLVLHPGIDELASEYVELNDVEEFGSVLDRIVGLLV
ncbi:hypothetical protein [Amycolatopsis sp. CA-128772]|uniref:hypothetical protein n=1 Tax=Amycolatopsis sp. CA-128772 TaxID=2073159 RepID=UPI000CD2A130|nr:hypothetical protein [Amycolatopsis sp. CA-128772]